MACVSTLSRVVAAFIVVSLPVWRSAAFADAAPDVNSVCGSPPHGNIALDGSKATKKQMENAKLDVIAFMADSDIYQDCINKYLARYQSILTPQDKSRLAGLQQFNQKEKEKIGNGYNAAADAFNKTHGH